MASISKINVEMPAGEGGETSVEQYDIAALKLVRPADRNPWDVGDQNTPVYFHDGIPMVCTGGGGGGGGGSDVSITPQYSGGILIANYQIDGVDGEIRAPRTDFVYKRSVLWSGNLSDVGDSNINNPFSSTFGNYSFLLVHYAPSNNLTEERTMMLDTQAFISLNNAIFSCHYLSDVFIKCQFISQSVFQVIESRSLPLDNEQESTLLKCVITKIEGFQFGVSGEDLNQGLTVRKVLWSGLVDEVEEGGELNSSIESYNYIYIHYYESDNQYDERIIILDTEAVLRGLKQTPSQAIFNCYFNDSLYIKGQFLTTSSFEVIELETEIEPYRKCVINKIEGICMGSVNDSGGSGGGDISTCMIKGVDYVTAGAREGNKTGEYATIEGYGNTTSDNIYLIHIEGQNNYASATGAHVEGERNRGEGAYCHIEGFENRVTGLNGHAEGQWVRVFGRNAHGEGLLTTAREENSHTEGYKNCADGFAAHAEGGVSSSASWIDVANYASGDLSHVEGSCTSAYGLAAHAEGYCTCAQGEYSHAEGDYTTARGDNSHAEGHYAYAFGSDSHAEGNHTTAKDSCSHAEGWYTFANSYSHAEGQNTTAYGGCSHAEGERTYAYAYKSHAEGYKTTAYSYNCHAEGYGTYAYSGSDHSSSHAEGRLTSVYGDSSHAEGSLTYTSGNKSHVEGYMTSAYNLGAHAEGYRTCSYNRFCHAEGVDTRAIGDWGSHAEGRETTAYGNNSHAEGSSTSAYGSYSHAEGGGTTAYGAGSHAEGQDTYAKGKYSHAGGYYTTASNYASCSIGKDSEAMSDGGNYNNQTGTVFIIGNGYYDSGSQQQINSNAFSVMYNGTISSLNTQNNPGQDYAENFEWSDSNINEEDRVGYFVTFDKNNKIRIANSNDDYILGIVSGSPSVLGNSDCDIWNQMYLRDNFNRFLEEDAPLYETNPETGEEEPVLDDEGNQVYQGKRFVLNPDYDDSQEYVRRSERSEWAPVGMLGVLSVRDDGTCQVDKYCKVNDSGIATYQATYSKNENYYRVIERVAENVIKVVFR